MLHGLVSRRAFCSSTSIFCGLDWFTLESQFVAVEGLPRFHRG
jgi:hypothetical protein